MDPKTFHGQCANVMVVDDTPDNLRLASTMLAEHGFRVRPFADSLMAFDSALRNPPDIVLLDINMPGINGFEFCRRMKADPKLREVPVLFLSANLDTEAKLAAFNQGGADYITKPFHFEEVEARVRTHLSLRCLRLQLEQHNQRLEDRVALQVKEISDAQNATILALAKLAEFRDDDTGRHIERVRTYARLLAEVLLRANGHHGELDARFVDTIHQASPLHDIGKVGIPDQILLKPGRLTPDEFRIIKSHTIMGAMTLEAVHGCYPGNEFIRMGLDIARSHHERWNGEGYPQGLAQTAIPLSARIVAVADVYDALRSRRPYKEPFTHERACEVIVAEAGKQFDPEIVQVFEEVEESMASIRGQLQE